MSATLAAVTTTVCTSWLSRSAPMCAFIPKYHWLPLRVWCISGSRFFSLFLVEGGAAISAGRDRAVEPVAQSGFVYLDGPNSDPGHSRRGARLRWKHYSRRRSADYRRQRAERANCQAGNNSAADAQPQGLSLRRKSSSVILVGHPNSDRKSTRLNSSHLGIS